MRSPERLPVRIVGGGLAGCEAALVLSAAGHPVDLVEMRPDVRTPAHATGSFAELVCSNSLGSEKVETGKGLLKAELRAMGCNLLALAEKVRVPAGMALAVDRERFGRVVDDAIGRRPGIRVIRAEQTEVPDDPWAIVACGPLPSDSLSGAISRLLGSGGLYFYDAISPIVDASTVDPECSFVGDRYGDGVGDYLNLPMSKDEYEAFYAELMAARKVPSRDFEEEKHFEACMPIEALGARGPDTLLFGPFKPVGLRDPRTGMRPHAVVQARKENVEGTMYNLVGFQTKLAWPEQARVFRMIPALRNAEFLRYGSVHRNSYIDSRHHLLPSLECRNRPGLFFAGQVTGVEGYIESIASGFAAGLALASRLAGAGPTQFPAESMIGALIRFVTTPAPVPFQPMNANFGLLPQPAPGRKKDRKARQAAAALDSIDRYRRETFHFEPLCVK
jgi:methylenetetrahydrofolate--tRNA-(uracil-5-)-methyltransferase